MLGPRFRTVLAGLLPALAGLALLAWSTGARLAGAGDPWAHQPKRFWEDLGLATGIYRYREFPVSHNPFVRYRAPDGQRLYTEPRGTFARTTKEAGIRPWQFWRTVADDAFERRNRAPLFKRFDDAGRAILLGVLFELRGGIAPFLIFWLGLLVAAPLLVWTSLELAFSGHPIAGAVFALLFGASAFAADMLSLTYAAIGFYLAGALTVAPVAVYACLSRQITAPGLLVRSAAAGVAFAICALSRSSCLLLTPGLLLAVAVAATRLHGRTRRAALYAAASLAVFAIPYVAASLAVARVTKRTLEAHGEGRSVPQNHPVWFNLWAGLGDFDRTKGYVWEDAVVSAAAVRHGGTPIGPSFLDPANEPILRDLMLRDVTADPSWYAGIIARRIAVTVTQWKLWPWRPLDGVSMAPRAHPNEGQIDSYYALTATVDFFGFGSRLFEAPLSVLLLPTWGLVALWVSRRDAAHRAALAPSLGVIFMVALATLPLPVLITTAAGLETQVFAMAYFLGIAFCVEWVVGRFSAPGSSGIAAVPNRSRGSATPSRRGSP